MSFAFNTQGSIKNPFGNTSGGLFGKITSGLGFNQKPITPQPTSGVMVDQPRQPQPVSQPNSMAWSTGAVSKPTSGMLPQTKPTTPVKSVTTPDGSKTEYHAPPAEVKPQNAPPVTNTQFKPAENAQRVLDVSDLTNDPLYKQARENMLTINAAQQNAQLAGTAGAGSNTLNQETTDKLGNPYSNIFRSQSTGNLAGEKGLLNPLLSQAGTFATGQAQTALDAAKLAQTGATSVLGAGMPGQISGSARLYNPLEGAGANSSIESGVNNQSKYDLLNQYNAGKATLNQASGIEQQILSTLQSNPGLNSQPLSALTNLSEFLSGQSSLPGQQLLSQQVNNYIKTLGLDTASVANIAHQQNMTLAQLLQSLKETATNNNEALKKTADGLGNNSSGGSTEGGMAEVW